MSDETVDTTTEAPSSNTRRPGPGLVQIQRSDRGWELTLEGYTEAGAVGEYLWPGGVPAGVRIVLLVVVEEPAQVGRFELTGLTSEALQTMEPWIANWFAQESVVTDNSSGSPDPSGSTQPDPAAGPGVDGVVMDEDALREWVGRELEGVSWIGDTAEVVGIFAAEGSVLASVAEILGPFGTVADTIIVLWAVVRAFGTGTRLQEQEGFCYGLMWETFGLPDGNKVFLDWPAGDSADDLRQAFFDGVAQGREKARDAKVHNAIIMKVAYYMVTVPCDHTSAQQNLINELWKKIREGEHTRDWLEWPNPADMVP